ncbi:hypothetical protein [Streptomyces sp. NPDC021224]|uniref:hypothetical protein n=1 Tax=unclassified Streptomyces TaxID=2593676 RepID=UPI00379004CB
MGAPDADRLDTACRHDMQLITTSVGKIQGAIGDVISLMGPDTWSGTPAQNWETDARGRMAQLLRLFTTYPPEQDRLIEKARQDQDAKDSKRTGT